MPVDLPVERLWQGVSQQPPWDRLRGQVERALNCRHDIPLYGSVKRSPLRFVANLDELGTATEYLFFAIRGAIVAIGENDIAAWDDDGAALTVNDESSAVGDFDAYLDAPAVFRPLRDLDYAVGMDTAIIVNRRKNVTNTTAFTYQQSLNFIITGDETDNVHGITITDNTGTPVQFFSDLPTSPSNGDVHKVRFDENFDPRGFYIYYDASEGEYEQTIFPNHGNWYRIPRSGQGAAQYDADVMPHKIVYDEDAATITFDRIEWAQRLTGAKGDNPPMPFVGDEIRAVAFLRGRLFLLSRDTINASRQSDYFNFFVNVSGDPADDDRISINFDSNNAGAIMRAEPLGDHLFLLCENSQFQYGADDQGLTATTGRYRRIRSLPAQDIKPLASDTLLAVLDSANNLHHFRWRGWNFGGIGYVAWMNSHAPTIFQSKDALGVFSVPNATFLCFDGENAWMHDHLESAEQIVQSALGELESEVGEIVFISEWGDHIRVILKADDGYWLAHYEHRLPTKENLLDYAVHLDRLERVSGTYDADLNQTFFEHTGTNGDLAGSCLVLRTDQALVGPAHHYLIPKSLTTDGRVGFGGEITGQHYLGFLYDMESEQSEQWAGSDTHRMNATDLESFHVGSVAYTAEITADDGTVKTSRKGIFKGERTTETGFIRHGFIFDTRKQRVTLKSRSPGPVVWTNVNYVVDKRGKP